MANGTEVVEERWHPWPVSWSGVWVGALSALATALILGLTAIAVGQQLIDPQQPFVDWRKVHLGSLIFSVFAAFLSYVVAGWVAASIAGFRRSEPAMLHGAIAWLVTIPCLLLLAALGAGSYFGGWYGGLSGRPAWATSTPTAIVPAAADTEANKSLAEAEQARRAQELRIARNNAIGAVTGLLLGLLGSVIGGWMASGEPMTLTHYRTRKQYAYGNTAEAKFTV